MKKYITYLMAVALFSSLFVTEGCYYDHEETLYHITPVNCAEINSSYALYVSRIIRDNCTSSGCHNESAAAGLTLLTYAQVAANVDKINRRVLVYKTMPPGKAMTIADLNILKCWIASGHPEN